MVVFDEGNTYKFSLTTQTFFILPVFFIWVNKPAAYTDGKIMGIKDMTLKLRRNVGCAQPMPRL